MINHQTANQDRYIIVGLHTLTATERAGLESAMIAEYRDKYINLREYMSSQQAVNDANALGYPITLQSRIKKIWKMGRFLNAFYRMRCILMRLGIDWLEI